MTLIDRFSTMVFKTIIFERIRYMKTAGVDPKFVINFGQFIEYLLSHGISPDEILKDRLPVFPPYRHLKFDNKEDCDRFCDTIKSWYGLDYQSKQSKNKLWRLKAC